MSNFLCVTALIIKLVSCLASARNIHIHFFSLLNEINLNIGHVMIKPFHDDVCTSVGFARKHTIAQMRRIFVIFYSIV